MNNEKLTSKEVAKCFGILGYINNNLTPPPFSECVILDKNEFKPLSRGNILEALEKYNAKTLPSLDSGIHIYWSEDYLVPEGITGSNIWTIDNSLYTPENGNVWILRIIDEDRDIGIKFYCRRQA